VQNVKGGKSPVVAETRIKTRGLGQTTCNGTGGYRIQEGRFFEIKASVRGRRSCASALGERKKVRKTLGEVWWMVPGFWGV